MKRLMEKIVFLGLVTAWRLATVPTRRSPLAVKATTEGVVRPPSAFSMTVGSPPSRTAMHEFVVPRSMPMVLAMGRGWLLATCFCLLALDAKNLSPSVADRKGGSVVGDAAFAGNDRPEPDVARRLPGQSRGGAREVDPTRRVHWRAVAGRSLRSAELSATGPPAHRPTRPPAHRLARPRRTRGSLPSARRRRDLAPVRAHPAGLVVGQGVRAVERAG